MYITWHIITHFLWALFAFLIRNILTKLLWDLFTLGEVHQLTHLYRDVPTDTFLTMILLKKVR